MLCSNPIVTGGSRAFPCGQCLACRFNRRRVWTHRMMLEQLGHADSAFVTLTYSPEEEPKDGSLQPKDLQDWLKRIRKSVAPLRLRYYAVGEYGDQTGRPHYHAAVFGLPTCTAGGTNNHISPRSYCVRCNLVSNTWGKGRIFLGELTRESCQYVAGYVTKKLTSPTDPRLNGRYPEFARMSKMPGLGTGVLDAVVESLRQHNLDLPQTDVPSGLRHGTSILPLGRFLRIQLRRKLGRPDQVPKEVALEESRKMLALWLSAADRSDFESKASWEARQAKQKTPQGIARSLIYKKRGPL